MLDARMKSMVKDEITPSNPIKKKRAPVNYIDNKAFFEAMRKYKDNPEKGVSNYIGKCLMDITEHLGTMPAFRNYSYLDLMKSDGIENCLQYIHNYNPDKYNNPLAYFTRIVYYAFLRRIAREKKEQYVKYKMTASYGLYNDVVFGNSDKNVEVFDNIADFIELFEAKKKEKDAKKIKKKPKKGVEQYAETDLETLDID